MIKSYRSNKLKVAIVDYKLSNLFSVKHACEYVGLDTFITSDKSELIRADALLLPGVGAFGDAMKNLKEMGLINLIKQHIAISKPFMGVCLGMQLIFSESEEFGLQKGMDLVKGKVKKFPRINEKEEVVKVPQIGWNKIYNQDYTKWNKSPFNMIENNSSMFFAHSYYVIPDDKNMVLSLTTYKGIEYCSSILYKNIFAVQFHPEKSATKGLTIYKSWSEYIRMNV